MSYILGDRESMEARLKTMSGLEFLVAQEPAETNPGAGTGVWVIRKQTRRKRSGVEDEVVPLSSYFIVGENIYMAPTVGSILSNRLLSIFTSLNTFFSEASALPTFTPAAGHTYLPPTTPKPKPSFNSSFSQASKENTPVPDSVATQMLKKALPTNTSNTTYLNSLLLSESIRMSLQYGDEYMDDNPITGQPGDFHFTNTGRKSQLDKGKLLVPTATKGSVNRLSAPPTPVVEPKGLGAADKQDGKDKKASKGDKSPRTPGMPKPKRRKSKIGSAGGSTTPK